MKKTSFALLNGIVAGICAIALIGFFIMPFWTVKIAISFNEEVAEILFEDAMADDEESSESEESIDSEEDSEELDMTAILIKELAEEEIKLEIAVSIDTGLLMNCALSSSKKSAKDFVYDLIDDLVASVDEDTLEEIENSIAKAGVTSAVKVELAELAKDLDVDVDELMDDIGIDENYLDSRTEDLLSAIREEDATVDSVTDVVVDIVDEIYEKYGNSEYADDEFEELTPEEREELRAEIADIVGELADEEGNIDGDGLLSALLSGLLSEEDIELPEEEAFRGAGVTYAMHRLFSSESESESEFESEEEQKPFDEMLRDELREAVTDEVLDAVQLVALIYFILFAFSAFWWIFLIIKILCKIGMKNPLISLKSAIAFGGTAFTILVIIPSLAFGMLANPPSFIADMLDRETLDIMKTLFDGAIKISFSSSAIIAFICSLALFGFGFYYSSKRMAIKRAIKQKKREEAQSGGLY